MCESIDVNELLACLEGDTRTLSERRPYGLTDAQLTTALDATQTFIGRLLAVQATLAREADTRGIVRAAGSTNASTWLRDRLHISIAEAHKITAFGALLDTRPDIAAAVAEGTATAEQALAIGRTLAELPTECDPAVADAVVAALLGHARNLDPAYLRQLGDRVLHHVAPDLADELLRRRLERDERQAARDRTLSLTPDGNGRVRLYGILDNEAAATVRSALEPLMKPVPNGPAGPDLRTPAARRADALLEVCRLALRTGELPADGGQPAQLNVTIDYTALASAVRDGNAYSSAGCAGANGIAYATGILDTGEYLSATVVRRMACDAGILPVVLGGAGIPIDVGRMRRLYTGAARAAVLLRDHGCAFPGCDRPPKWCDIHHIRSWIDGGPTDRDNGVALCGHHHRLIHNDAWTVILDEDRRPTFIPPANIDSGQAPRRNPYHLRT